MPRTSFDPRRHGFGFSNHFTNDFIPELDIRTSGLCGGMSYAALDYYFKDKRVPEQDYEPALHTPLHDYIYDRQVNSIVDNLDKWVEMGFNPLGVRDSQFFNWGLQGFDGGRIEELREMIDSGKPVPLGLQAYEGAAGNHQVVAIGYDMGRYRGDLGDHKEDFKIFVYDPDRRGREMTLIPNVNSQCYTYREGSCRWRTYFVDKKYKPKNPPTIVPDGRIANDGKVTELLLTFRTADDDLRGGNDNLNVTLDIHGQSPQHVPNINGSRRWVDNSNQTVRIRLDEPTEFRNISRIILTTTASGGLGGDNWNLQSIFIQARGRGVSEIVHRIGNPLHRFTGDDRELIVNF